MTTLFDLLDFAPETPQWAADCFYCTPDTTGYYDLARHQWAHLPMTCAICRRTSPNRLLFDQAHGVNLGASWESGYLLCSSLSLKLNHLRYDLLNGHAHDARDLTPLELGWTLTPDGTPIAPAGWPAAPDTAAMGGIALEDATSESARS
jgi:hypothetical protein